jgi:hypothetical protein
METFAKIFDLPARQVLVTTEYDPDEEEWKLRTETRYDGMMIAISGSYSSKESLDEAFGKYNQSNAEALLEESDKIYTKFYK